MEKIRFNGKNLESCLDKASKEFNVSVGDIKYEIINGKASFLKKTFTIEAYVATDKKIKEETKFKEKHRVDYSRGTAKIEGGKLLIKNPENNSNKATIIKGKGITLYVDGEEVLGKASVSEESTIEIVFEENEAKRELNIKTTEDKLQAYISLKYSPKITYGLEDVEEGNNITLNAKVISEGYPPKYSSTEIINELKNKGITFGIINENIEKCNEIYNVEDLLVASGQPVENGEDDMVEVYFKCTSKKEFQVDESGNVDFKSIGKIDGVKKGDILCKKINGKEGKTGKNVYNQVIQPKRRKIKDIIAKEGCEFSDSNTIISTIDGRPQVKGTVYSVHKVHEIINDVDIKTGNINFVGDVIIHGDIKEGMSVEAGNTIVVHSSVLRANLKAGSDIEVKGNIISSTLVSGIGYVELIKYIENLKGLAEVLKEIYETIFDIKQNKVLKTNIADSDLVRAIIESKYKGFRVRLTNTVKSMQDFKDVNNKVFKILYDKFSDAYFSNIKNYEDIKYAEELIREKLDSLETEEDNMSNVNASYIQDSNIECSGDIYITGKGIYKSNISSMGGIYFVGEGGSNARGGILKATKEIKAKVIGAPTGVNTVLAVSKEGHIYCDIAYFNTKFIIGDREFTIFDSYKSVHAYLDESNELIIDKFKL